MKRLDEEFALLLEAVSSVEANLAKSLLDAEGIPSLIQGPDFDVAELGRAAHDGLRGTNLYVPQSARERATGILEAAWGDSESTAESTGKPATTGDTESAGEPGAPAD